MNQFCGECIHNYVCKYAEKFSDKKASQVIKEGSETESIFTTTITCKYYKKSEPTIKEIELPKDTFTSKDYVLNTRDIGRNCESCSWYNTYIAEGKTYVGDCPCNWCDKSPIKVTC